MVSENLEAVRCCDIVLHGEECSAPATSVCPRCEAAVCDDHRRVWYGEYGCVLCLASPPVVASPAPRARCSCDNPEIGPHDTDGVPILADDDGIVGGQGRMAEELRTAADFVVGTVFIGAGLAVLVWGILSATGVLR